MRLLRSLPFEWVYMRCACKYLLFLLGQFNQSVMFRLLLLEFNTVMVWVINIVDLLYYLFTFLSDQLLK